MAKKKMVDDKAVVRQLASTVHRDVLIKRMLSASSQKEKELYKKALELQAKRSVEADVKIAIKKGALKGKKEPEKEVKQLVEAYATKHERIIKRKIKDIAKEVAKEKAKKVPEMYSVELKKGEDTAKIIASKGFLKKLEEATKEKVKEQEKIKEQEKEPESKFVPKKDLAVIKPFKEEEFSRFRLAKFEEPEKKDKFMEKVESIGKKISEKTKYWAYPIVEFGTGVVSALSYPGRALAKPKETISSLTYGLTHPTLLARGTAEYFIEKPYRFMGELAGATAFGKAVGKGIEKAKGLFKKQKIEIERIKLPEHTEEIKLVSANQKAIGRIKYELPKSKEAYSPSDKILIKITTRKLIPVDKEIYILKTHSRYDVLTARQFRKVAKIYMMKKSEELANIFPAKTYRILGKADEGILKNLKEEIKLETIIGKPETPKLPLELARKEAYATFRKGVKDLWAMRTKEKLVIEKAPKIKSMLIKMKQKVTAPFTKTTQKLKEQLSMKKLAKEISQPSTKPQATQPLITQLVLKEEPALLIKMKGITKEIVKKLPKTEPAKIKSIFIPSFLRITKPTSKAKEREIIKAKRKVVAKEKIKPEEISILKVKPLEGILPKLGFKFKEFSIPKPKISPKLVEKEMLGIREKEKVKIGKITIPKPAVEPEVKPRIAFKIPSMPKPKKVKPTISIRGRRKPSKEVKRKTKKAKKVYWQKVNPWAYVRNVLKHFKF